MPSRKMSDSGSGDSGGEGNSRNEAPSKTPSPPPPAQPVFRHSAMDLTGQPRLLVLQEPQENFHKDEGGKANQLTFRVMLQGELPQEILSKAVDGILSLAVRPIFDDGQYADASVLDIVGGTDGTAPCIQLRTRVGGVRYRFTTVSKRLNNRAIGLVVSVVDCPSIEPIRSEATMVFSKRKNKEQRLEEQARERNELLERQRAAQLLLSARASPGIEASAPMNHKEGDGSNHAPPASISPAPGQQAGNLKFPVAQGATGLPPQFVPAAPAIFRPRPRRISREKESESDSDSDGKSSVSRKKKRVTNGPSVGRGNQRELEERVSKLEAALQANVRELEEMRAAMNLCFYQLGAERGALRRSSSQNVPWEFSEQPPSYEPPASAPLVSSLTMPSPQPARSPFELDSWVNGGIVNGAENQLLRLRRDISSGSSQLPSPRSASAMGAPTTMIKRSASENSSGENRV